MYQKFAVLHSDEQVCIRPASKFVETARRFKSNITIINDNELIDGKSVRGILVSALGKGSNITLKAEGPDEKEAINALYYLIEQYD
jgi:phosphocarrier protein